MKKFEDEKFFAVQCRRMAKPDSTPTRVRNDVLEAVADLLKRTGSRISVTLCLETIAREALAQIESETAPTQRLPFVDLMRQALGKPTPSLTEDMSLAERVLRLEKAIGSSWQPQTPNTPQLIPEPGSARSTPVEPAHTGKSSSVYTPSLNEDPPKPVRGARKVLREMAVREGGKKQR